jgi:hypothetical protein
MPMDAEARDVPLLTTKLYIPSLGAEQVPRSRLIQRLDAGLGRKLVSAPAGFGKTTLLSEWVTATDRSVAWLSLDEADSDPVRFWTYVVTALQRLPSHRQASVGTTSRATCPVHPGLLGQPSHRLLYGLHLWVLRRFGVSHRSCPTRHSMVGLGSYGRTIVSLQQVRIPRRTLDVQGGNQPRSRWDVRSGLGSGSGAIYCLAIACTLGCNTAGYDLYLPVGQRRVEMGRSGLDAADAAPEHVRSGYVRRPSSAMVPGRRPGGRTGNSEGG